MSNQEVTFYFQRSELPCRTLSATLTLDDHFQLAGEIIDPSPEILSLLIRPDLDVVVGVAGKTYRIKDLQQDGKIALTPLTVGA